MKSVQDITFFLDPDSATHLSGVKEPTKVVLYNTETDKLLYFGSMKEWFEQFKSYEKHKERKTQKHE